MVNYYLIMNLYDEARNINKSANLDVHFEMDGSRESPLWPSIR